MVLRPSPSSPSGSVMSSCEIEMVGSDALEFNALILRNNL